MLPLWKSKGNAQLLAASTVTGKRCDMRVTVKQSAFALIKYAGHGADCNTGWLGAGFRPELQT
jgi:hypothetical protein